MKVLILAKDFDNNKIAPYRRIKSFIDYLEEASINCKILTEKKNNINNYSSNAEIIKFKSLNFNKEKFSVRLLSEIYLLIRVFINGLFTKNIDIILSTSPSFLFLISGYLLSIIKNKPLILDIRDMYPDCVVELNFIKNKKIIHFLKLIEKKSYLHAKSIITVSENMKKIIYQKINTKKIVTIENVPFNKELNRINSSIINNEDKINIIITGNMGYVYNFDIIIESIIKLKINKNLKFHIIGNGVKFNKIKKILKKNNLDNVSLNQSIDISELNSIYKKADIALLALYDIPFMKSCIPVSQLDYMNHELPIILSSGDCEGKKIINNSKCGITCTPDSTLDFIDSIKKLSNDIKLRKSLGQNGRRYINNVWLKKNRKKIFLDQINKALNNK